MNTMPFFFNQCIDKGRLKRMILWSLTYQGEHKTLQLIENLKTLGFKYATYAGVSLNIDDLSIPPKKKVSVLEAEGLVAEGVQGALRGDRSAIEGLQNVIDTWHRTSENVKDHVIEYFEATNILNPVYMMAFSGARGNVSQVRQLVGMRGLMADPSGNIIGFPIRSNFREGLTVTEYMISCYGARKGVVDTALRTADAGYLTRRLVDVAQHVVVQKGSCGTRRGIKIASLYDGRKKVISLAERLLGRVLATDILEGHTVIGRRNQAISESFALRLSQLSEQAHPHGPLTISVRSPLTCELTYGVCQLCYGWSLAQSSLVTLGEAVGVIAGQSIGEPGTQLTMRTFHTGGVFTGDVQDEFRSPHQGIVHFPAPLHGLLVRTSYGQISFLVKVAGTLILVDRQQQRQTHIHIPVHTALFAREGQFVQFNQLLGQFGDVDNQQNERVKTRKIVAAPFDGEVFFQNVKVTNTLLLENAPRKRYSAPTKLGTVWVLAGKYLSQKQGLLPIFKTSGQLLASQSLLRRVTVLSDIEGFITNLPATLLRGQANQKIPLLSQTTAERLQPRTPLPAMASVPVLRMPVFAAKRTLSTPYRYVGGRQVLCTERQEMFVLVETPKYFPSTSRQQGRPMSLTSPAPGLKSPKGRKVSLLYFNEYFKTAGGGEVWSDNSLLSKNRFHGFLFWTSYLQKTSSSETSKRARLTGWKDSRAKITTKAPARLPVHLPLEGLHWVHKDEPLYTIQTVQGKEKTYNASVSGLVHYKTRETWGAQRHSNKIHVAHPPRLNPLAKNPSLVYKLTPVVAGTHGRLSFAGQFPFPNERIGCRPRMKLRLYPGWVFLPSLTAFQGNKPTGVPLQGLPHFDGNRVTFTSFLINMTTTPNAYTASATSPTPVQRPRKLYTWVAKKKRPESLGISFLGGLRALACLRHPHLLKTSFLHRKVITEHVGLFSVIHYAQSPGYTLFAPSTIKGPSGRLYFSAFTGWVYSTPDLGQPGGFPTGLIFVQKYTPKQLSASHLNSTFILLYRTIQEYSLSRIVGIKHKLQGYQSFEENEYLDFRDVSHRKRDLLPLWSKQMPSSLRQTPRKAFFLSLRILPEKNYAPTPTFMLRFFVDLGIVGARSKKPTLTFETPWNAPTTKGLRWNLAFYQQPKGARLKDTLFGSLHGMILSGQPGLLRQVPVASEGEVYTRPDNKCILLRPTDSRSFQLPCSETTAFPPYRVSVGQMVRYGDELCPDIASPESGQVIAIEGATLTLRRGQPILFYETGTMLHVRHDQWLDLGQPLVTLTYQRLITGDIVQGIPKVEQVFEASHSRHVKGNLKRLLRAKFKAFKQKMSPPFATRQSLDFIQKEIIERIQKIYLAQGVNIANKHFEIIVRQMTSSVKVLDPGDTGLFRNEKVSLNRVENINMSIEEEAENQKAPYTRCITPSVPIRKARYEPVVVGISEMALNSNSFLSAASFQETTRILTRDSILRKTDFLRGLKERVILGDLIPAGTGLAEIISYRTAPSDPGDFYWEPSPAEFIEVVSNLENRYWNPIGLKNPENAVDAIWPSPPWLREEKP